MRIEMKKGILCILILLVTGCGKPPEKETKKVEAISVTTAKPAISSIILTTTLQGNILPIREAKISPKMGGKLLEIHVKENTAVRQGDVVANLDPTDARIKLSQAEAGLSTAKAGLKQAETNLELIKIEFERAQRLKESNSIAQSAFDKASMNYKMACAQVELANTQVAQADAGLTAAKQQLTDTNITSPIAGIITSKSVNQGEEVKSGNTILTVMDISTVKVELAVSENLITNIKKGSKAEVSLDAYPNKRFMGIIQDIFPTINPQSRTFSCFLHIPNSEYLIKPGMFCRVTLDLERHKDVMCVPQGVVFNRGLENYLYVVEKNHAVLKQVKLGIADLEKVEITEGLSPEEEVIIRGVENLQDGAMVQDFIQ